MFFAILGHHDAVPLFRHIARSSVTNSVLPLDLKVQHVCYEDEERNASFLTNELSSTASNSD